MLLLSYPRAGLSIGLVLVAQLAGSNALAGSLVPGDLVLADQGNLIFRVDSESGDREVISSNSMGFGPPLQGPIDISIESDGKLIISHSGGTLLRVDPASGNRSIVSSAGVGTGIIVSLFHSTTLEPDGNILVAAFSEDAIVRVDPVSGNRTVVSSSIVGSGPVFTPTFLALGMGVNELIAVANQLAIYRVDTVTGDRTLISSAARGTGLSLNFPFDLVVEADGSILVANSDPNREVALGG